MKTTGLSPIRRWIDRIWRVTFVATWRGVFPTGDALRSRPGRTEGPLDALERVCEDMHETSMSAIARQIRGLQSGAASSECHCVSAHLTGSRQATLRMLETVRPLLAGMATSGDDETRDRIFGRCFSEHG